MCTMVDKYKYLGNVLGENLNYETTAHVLSYTANQAPGSLINKYKHINGMGFYTYTKLFSCGVSPILDYGSEIWGYRKFKDIDCIQNKAIRVYLGIHKFAPLAAINGDMGWSNSNIRQKNSNDYAL